MSRPTKLMYHTYTLRRFTGGNGVRLPVLLTRRKIDFGDFDELFFRDPQGKVRSAKEAGATSRPPRAIYLTAGPGGGKRLRMTTEGMFATGTAANHVSMVSVAAEITQ